MTIPTTAGHQLTKIVPSPQKPHHIELTFEDGKSFVMPYLDLRFECPCATCVDEMTGKRTLKKESLKPDVKPMVIQPVGRYAVHIEWSDGHRTGMYHFDRLYDLCSGLITH
jgi:DUF971 family protein